MTNKGWVRAGVIAGYLVLPPTYAPLVAQFFTRHTTHPPTAQEKPNKTIAIALANVGWLQFLGVATFGLGSAFLLRASRIAFGSRGNDISQNSDASLKIHTAYYGTGPIDDVSVLSVVERYPRKAIAIPVESGALGLTPALGSGVRRLEIEYSYGSSKRETISRRQGQVLVVPEDPSAKNEIQQLRAELEEQIDRTDRERRGRLKEVAKLKKQALLTQSAKRRIDELEGEIESLKAELAKGE